MVGKGSTVATKNANAKSAPKTKSDRSAKEPILSKQQTQKTTANVVNAESGRKAEPLKKPEAPASVKTATQQVTTKEAVIPEAQTSETALLKLKISKSLYLKLKRTAQEESLAVDDLAAELLTEGVVLRAWEIIERKAAMRSDGNHTGGNQPRGNNNNFHRNNNNHHKRNNNSGGGRRMGAQGGGFNNNVMDDNASFMEYVRNQGPNNRR